MTKILVAEDDAALLKVYQAKLSKVGFEVKVARDGDEVGLVLQDFTPDIILLDLVMPKKDGFDVLKELKESPKLKKIPVIVTTNLGQPEDKQKATALGAVDYLVKSDTPIQGIVDRVRQYLDK